MTQFFAKKLNKKGFTLAELLIVVAIIAVLVAIAIPIFNNSLVRTRYGVHYSNGRALKSMAVAELLTSSDFADLNIDDKTIYIASGSYDFNSEQFELKAITIGGSDVKSIGIWGRQADTGLINGLTASWIKNFDTETPTTGWTEFEEDGIKTIGSWGTGKNSSKVAYVITFKGIEVQESLVSLGST